LFPAWARQLGLGDVRLVGCDLPIHADPERYREVVARIKTGEQELGALITTHKIDLFEACRDLFDGVDDYAELCGEASCLAKRDGQLWAFATDPISSGRALAEFYEPGDGAQVLCLGAGGSATAITVHMLERQIASGITVVDRDPRRLKALEAIHAKVGSQTGVEYVENSDPRTNDRLIAELPPGSLVINATGMGKDVPGSPISEAAVFPEGGYAWELNYRGELDFFRLAERQRAGRNLRLEDGWRYFIHGWAVVMERVFDIEIDRQGVARISAISQSLRPKRD
jgi:shikimate 5-dehydrogenase